MEEEENNWAEEKWVDKTEKVWGPQSHWVGMKSEKNKK